MRNQQSSVDDSNCVQTRRAGVNLFEQWRVSIISKTSIPTAASVQYLCNILLVTGIMMATQKHNSVILWMCFEEMWDYNQRAPQWSCFLSLPCLIPTMMVIPWLSDLYHTEWCVFSHTRYSHDPKCTWRCPLPEIFLTQMHNLQA